MGPHALFDLLAAGLALSATALVHRWRLGNWIEATVTRVGPGYFAALVAGAGLGGYGFGTLNLWLSGLPGIGRSIVGALAGATLAVEFYKSARGLTGSTGALFVPAFCTTVVVGRVGCFLSGLSDSTYGTPTSLPWGHDFGDGIPRHPVQLYESCVMALFLIWFLIALRRRAPVAVRSGFYLMVGVYAVQRFAWEFLKPYASVVGPLNVFHLVCAGLVVYAVVMLRRSAHV